MKKFIFIFALVTMFINVKSQTTLENYQAMYIYNFTKLVDLDCNSITFDIIVLGNNLIYKELVDKFSDKLIKGKVVNVLLIKNISEIKDCQILYSNKNIDYNSLSLKNTLVIGSNKIYSKYLDILFEVESSGKLIYYLNNNNKNIKFSSNIITMSYNKKL